MTHRGPFQPLLFCDSVTWLGRDKKPLNYCIPALFLLKRIFQLLFCQAGIFPGQAACLNFRFSPNLSQVTGAVCAASAPPGKRQLHPRRFPSSTTEPASHVLFHLPHQGEGR